MTAKELKEGDWADPICTECVHEIQTGYTIVTPKQICHTI